VVKTVFSGGGDYWKWEEIKKEWMGWIWYM
jgi:hypothetical protein